MKGKTLKICGLVVMLVFGLAMLFPTAIAQSEKGMYSPGHGDTPPGKGGTPPGQGGIPPGLASNLGLSMNGDQVYWGDPDIMIGIGTIDPQYTLDVDGDIHAMGSLILGNSVTFDPNGNIILDDITKTLEIYNKDAIPYYTDLFIDSENQYVGIGTKIVVAGVRLGVDGNVLATGSITADGGDSGQWNDAYGWGDHSAEGYLTSYTETDPVFGAWDKTTGITITESQITDLDHFTNSDETDPVFSAWDKTTGIAIAESQITDLDHFTTADETDPIFGAWDKSTGISITESQITDLDHFTSADETDPEVGTNTLNYVSKWDGSKLVTGTIYDNGNIGIGTSTPLFKLDVMGNARFEGSYPSIRLYGTETSTGLNSNFYMIQEYQKKFLIRHWASAPSPYSWKTRLTIDDTGDVGIGTISPQRDLHVDDTIRLEPRSSAPTSPAKGDIYFNGSTNKLMVYDGTAWKSCW
jgi:hypothetical protein